MTAEPLLLTNPCTLPHTQVPEHTWGVDIKDSLPDYRNWSNADFHAAMAARTPMYGSTVYSWVRQKAYLRWALDALGATRCVAAAHAAVASQQ
jgi:hypothetical protein